MLHSPTRWSSSFAPSVSLKRTISEVSADDYMHIWPCKRLSASPSYDQRVPSTPPGSYMSKHLSYLRRHDSIGSSCSEDSFCSDDADDTTPTNEGVKDFLDQMSLGKYWTNFKTRGFDREDDILNLAESDLDVLNITCTHDRQLILEAAKNYVVTPDFKLHCWLAKNGLEHYFSNFVLNEYIELKDIENIDLSPDTYDQLEITLPGHKKRLERAVSHLRKRRRSESEQGGTMLGCGYWGKPPALQDAKNDFLCLRADVQSTRPHGKSHNIEFMVDSGSDVTTIREELLAELDLEPITRIQSKGVHASVETMMYKAKLQIGDSEVETEVIGSHYDSIGNQVLRHFRHYIDHDRHIWLRGSNTPSPSKISSPKSQHEPDNLDCSLTSEECNDVFEESS